LFTLVLMVLALGCQNDSKQVTAPVQDMAALEPGLQDPLPQDVPVYQFIGDRVWHDVDRDGIQDPPRVEPGVAGVLVDLYTCDGVFVARDTSDAQGFVGFINPRPGDYKLYFHRPDGWTFTLPDQGSNNSTDSDPDPSTGFTVCTTLDSLELDFSWDAGVYPGAPPASVGDRVWIDADRDGIQDENESGRPDVQVILLTCAGMPVDTLITDGAGHYLFTGVEPGSYRIHFGLPEGYLFSPADQGLDDALDSDAAEGGMTACFDLAAGQTDRTRDAGIHLPVGSIGDRVWLDTDHDGIQDEGELGKGGVTVELLDAGGVVLATQVTNDDGSYLFGELAPGDYRVRFTLPDGYEFSPADQGSDDGLDSDALEAGTTALFSLAPGQDDRTRDAGLHSRDVPSGACCLPDGTCEILSAAACAQAGGEYEGDGTSCDPNPCPPPSREHCTLTQGGWSNNGRFNGERRSETLQRLVTPDSPLVLGVSGRSVTFADGSEGCISRLLPAGQTPTTLPSNLGDGVIDEGSCNTSPPLPLKSGRIKNVFLGQTLALALNTRLDETLSGVALSRRMTTTAGTFTIAPSVLAALGNENLPVTVGGLLTLANQSLAYGTVGGASLGDIHQAVTAINEMFVECQVLLGRED